MDAGFGIADLTMFTVDKYGGRPISFIPFSYPITFDEQIAAGATAIRQINILANCDFLLTQINASNPYGLSLTNFLRCMIVDSGSNEQYMQAPVHVGLLSPTYYRTNLVPYPRLIAGKTVLTVSLTNFGANAVATGYTMSFEGFSVYTMGG